MRDTQFDSRTADKFVARLPDGLRAKIEAIANTSDRSMNAVFIQAVRQYIDGQKRQELLLDALANAAVSGTAGIPVVAESMHIDERVRMAVDANRYRWLRDGALGTGSANVPMVRIGMGEPVGGADLDLVVDAVALNWPMLDEFDEEVVA